MLLTLIINYFLMLDFNLKKFNSEGFIIIKKGITESLLNRFCREIEDLLFLKFPEYSNLLKDEKINFRIPKLIALAEGEDPEKFYQLCMESNNLSSFSMVDVSKELKAFLTCFLESHPDKLFCNIFNGILINKKNVNRLKYGWHQEKSYYPLNNNGIHLWFPLFNNIEVTGGPMLLKKNTHTRDFEYEKIEKEKSVVQRKISEDDLDEYEIFECNLKLGDVIIFDHRVVHCTKEVLTKEIPRISGIKRYVA